MTVIIPLTQVIAHLRISACPYKCPLGFWYWHGASGRRYIHSVYSPDSCPPLPGAVFLAVRRLGALRTVLGAGHFAGLWDVNIATESASRWRDLGA
ncbi:MAG: hypothetical protein E6G89_12780, partial [Alphaproteobacteria bacterium]